MTSRFEPLAERPWKGISFLVLDEAGVVVERNRVRLPYREPDGKVRFWKLQRATGDEWYEPKPTEVGGLIPFGLETLPTSEQQQSLVLVCEGESDCLALREHVAEWSVFPAGVYAVALPGVATWRREWRSHFVDCPNLFVIPDGDDAGARMAARVRADLPWARFVQLPAGDDARSIVQAGGGEALVPFLDDANWLWRLGAALKLTDDLNEFRRLVSG